MKTPEKEMKSPQQRNYCSQLMSVIHLKNKISVVGKQRHGKIEKKLTNLNTSDWETCLSNSTVYVTMRYFLLFCPDEDGRELETSLVPTPVFCSFNSSRSAYVSRSRVTESLVCTQEKHNGFHSNTKQKA